MTKSLRLAHFLLLAISILGWAACQPIDEPREDEAARVDESEQALWTYPAKGSIADRQTVHGVLTNGDFGHFYSFYAEAGQTVTFALEWALPQSSGLGAVIQLRNNTGSIKYAEHATLSSNQSHLTYKFSATGTYRLYVKHYGYALFGSYPYKFGANPDLCAAWEGIYDGFEQGDVNFFVAANFPERITEDPWKVELNGGLSGDEAFHETGRTVDFGNCAELVSDHCGSSGPEVFEVWFPTGSLEVVENECEMRNDVYETAGTEEGWNLWWETCDAYPEACVAVTSRSASTP